MFVAVFFSPTPFSTSVIGGLYVGDLDVPGNISIPLLWDNKRDVTFIKGYYQLVIVRECHSPYTNTPTF